MDLVERRSKLIEKRYLRNLVEAIQLLALDYNDQIELLPDWVHLPDELALIFDDAFRLIDQIEGAGLINNKQIRGMRSLSNMLDREQKDFWTREAVESWQDWEVIREVARKLLHDLDAQNSIPSLNWIQFHKANRD